MQARRATNFFREDPTKSFIIKDLTGELNTTDPDVSVGDHQFSGGQNMRPISEKSVGKRYGTSLFGPFLGATTGITGGFNFINNSGTQAMLVVYNTGINLHTSTTSTALTSVTMTAGTQCDGCFYPITNKFFITNNTDNVVKYTSGAGGDQSDSSFKKGKYISHFKNRLLVANVSTQEDYVWYTNLALDTFAANNYFRVGAPVTGLQVLNDKILIFTKERVKRLVNFTFDGTGAFPSQLDDLPTTFGAIYDRTICVVNNLCYFLGQDTEGVCEIYVTDGYTVQPLGDKKIRATLDSLDAGQLATAAGGSDGKNYRLFLAESGQTTNNIGIVYNTSHKKFYTVERRQIAGRGDFSCIWSSEVSGQWVTYAGTQGTGQVYKLNANDGLYDELGEERYLTNGSYNVPIDANPAKRAAQSFKMSQYNNTQTVNLTRIALQLKKNTGTTTDLTVRIETDNNGTPSGTLVSAGATATISAFTETSYIWKMANFTSAVELTGNTSYWIVVQHATEGSGSSQYHWLGDSCTATYTYGNLATYQSLSNPTVTFTPDANPESTSVDGYANATAVPGTFSSQRAASGFFSSDTGSEIRVQLNYDPGSYPTKTFYAMSRGILLFDTSAIPDAATISSAVLQLYVTDKTNNLNDSVAVTAVTPASNTALVAADYNVANYGSTRFITDVGLTSLTTNAYNSFSLNASGIAAVSKTGVSKFGVRLVSDVDNTEPTFTAGLFNLTSQLLFQSSENTNKPRLVVTYSGGSTTTWVADTVTDQTFVIYAQSAIDAFGNGKAFLPNNGKEYQLHQFQTMFSTVANYGVEIGFDAGSYTSFQNYLVDLSGEAGSTYGTGIYGQSIYGGGQTRNFDWTHVDGFVGRTLKYTIRNRNANEQFEFNQVNTLLALRTRKD